jgi:hypothetical protein
VSERALPRRRWTEEREDPRLGVRRGCRPQPRAR